MASTISSLCEAFDEELNCCGRRYGGARLDEALDVFGQAAVAAEPCERSLDDPAAR